MASTVCRLVTGTYFNSDHKSIDILFLNEDDDEISSQYHTRKEQKDRDTISQMSIDSCDSREPVFVVAGDIRRRLSESINAPKAKHGFKRDPEDPSASILKEPWHEKGGS